MEHYRALTREWDLTQQSRLIFVKSPSESASAATTKIQSWGLKQHTFIPQSSEGWEVQDQGAGQFSVSCKLSSWLADSCLLDVCSPGLSLGVFVDGGKLWSLPLILEGHWSPHGSPTLLTSSQLNYLLKAPPPNTITSGVWASKYELWGDTNIQPVTVTLSEKANTRRNVQGIPRGT